MKRKNGRGEGRKRRRDRGFEEEGERVEVEKRESERSCPKEQHNLSAIYHYLEGSAFVTIQR